MCLYPRPIDNRKYKVNKKNRGNVPPLRDERIKKVAVGCQECVECRKQKARGWQLRLAEDIKHNKNGKFVTLTFSDTAIMELHEKVTGMIKQSIERIEQREIDPHERALKIQRLKTKLKGYSHDNAIATHAVKLFLERWRKDTGKSVRHWLVTELGHQGTQNIFS